MNFIRTTFAALALAATLAACSKGTSPENARAEDAPGSETPAPVAQDSTTGNTPQAAGNTATAASVLARTPEVQFQTQLASDYFPLDGNDVQAHPVITDPTILQQLTGKDWQAEFREWGQAGLSPLVKARFNGRTFVLMRSKFLTTAGVKYQVVGVVLDAQNQPLVAKVLFSPGRECAGAQNCFHTVTLTRQGIVECRYIQRTPNNPDERVVLRSFPVFNDPPLQGAI